MRIVVGVDEAVNVRKNKRTENIRRGHSCLSFYVGKSMWVILPHCGLVKGFNFESKKRSRRMCIKWWHIADTEILFCTNQFNKNSEPTKIPKSLFIRPSKRFVQFFCQLSDGNKFNSDRHVIKTGTTLPVQWKICTALYLFRQCVGCVCDPFWVDSPRSPNNLSINEIPVCLSSAYINIPVHWRNFFPFTMP